MKYQPPYGVADPNAPYVNGDPSIGRMGSIPPALAFEQPMREIVNMITLSGGTPSDADLQQLAKAIQSQRVNYAVDTGSQNHMVAALTPPFPATTPYPPGMIVRVKALYGNLDDVSHTTFSFDAGGGAWDVVRPDGSYPQTNDVPAGSIVQLASDGTRWQIESGALGTGGGGTSTVYTKIPYAADTSPTANQVTVAFTPAITAPAVGDVVLIKVANTVTGPTVINVNAIAAKNLTKNDTTVSALAPMDMVKNGIYLLEWDGTEWVLLNPAFGLLSLPTAPLYPEILTNGAVMQFSTSTGSVVLLDTSLWQWRGLRRYSTTMFVVGDRTFATSANKTYHLRWDAPGTGVALPTDTYPNGRFALRDLVDSSYNPSSFPEFYNNFDTTYDSMICARVTTDGANSPTVTPLMNKQYMLSQLAKTTQQETFSNPGDPAWQPNISITLNWSRTPRMSLLWTNQNALLSGSPFFGLAGFDMINGGSVPVGDSSGTWLNRYGVSRHGGALGLTGTSWVSLPWTARIEA